MSPATGSHYMMGGDEEECSGCDIVYQRGCFIRRFPSDHGTYVAEWMQIGRTQDRICLLYVTDNARHVQGVLSVPYTVTLAEIQSILMLS